ncbi:hypothetical protein [Salinimicrobium flavum]|uniref:Magnesium citrate secondary transporter n=1 Tax=Salinimicrobium flavum TaxID=1737065 RepID=A0ABW5IVG9_9FLAO
MKKILWTLVIFSGIFLFERFLSITGIPRPDWLRFYLNDFLCMPIILSLCLLTVQKLKKDSNIRLSLFTVLSLATFYSIYFEILLPQFMERYTADVIDVILYFTGSVLFYYLQEPPLPEKTIIRK